MTRISFRRHSWLFLASLTAALGLMWLAAADPPYAEKVANAQEQLKAPDVAAKIDSSSRGATVEQFDVHDLVGREGDSADLINVVRLANSPDQRDAESGSAQLGGADDVAIFRGTLIVRATSEGTAHGGARSVLSELRGDVGHGRLKPVWFQRDRILKALAQPGACDLDQVPLSDAVDYFKVKFGIEIQIDELSIGGPAVNRFPPISGHFKDVTLEQVLATILSDYGLDVAVEGEMLLVTTRERRARMTQLWRFDVHDLLASDGNMADLVKAVDVALPPHPNVATYRDAIFVRGTLADYRAVARMLADLRVNSKQKSPK